MRSEPRSRDSQARARAVGGFQPAPERNRNPVNRLRKYDDGGRKGPGFIGRIATPAARDSQTGQPEQARSGAPARNPATARPVVVGVGGSEERRRLGREGDRSPGPEGEGPSSRAPAHLVTVAGGGQELGAASRSASRATTATGSASPSGSSASNGAAASS